MRNLDFGLDTGENINQELIAARQKINGADFDRDARHLKMPVAYSRLTATTEFFIQVLSSQKPELAARLFRLDPVRKCAYGLDSVTTVMTHPTMGVALNDYDSFLIRSGLNGEMFTVIDIMKNNQANSLLLINNMAAKAIMQYYPDDFDDLAKADPIEFIRRKIATPLTRGTYPTLDTQYGLLSGFPRKSVKMYPEFDAIRKRFPNFAKAYQDFLLGNTGANEVYQVIDTLNIPDKERSLLLRILAEQARFNDRAAITAGGFLMLNSDDLYYAQRREQWFRYLDSIYKPIVQSTARF